MPLPRRGNSATRVNTPSADAFYRLVAARRGHFQLESGHHGALWFDLDDLFASHWRIAPFVAQLVALLRPHEVQIVCGPLLGGAFLAQLVAQSLGAEFCFTQRTVVGQPGALFGAEYRLPHAYSARVHGARVAMVDDVMSAGSALRGTYAELLRHGAIPVVAGAMLVLGRTGADHLLRERIAVVSVASEPYDLWLPSACPLCRSGPPLEHIAATPA